LRMQEGQLMATQGALALDTLKAQRQYEAGERIRAAIPEIPGDWRSTVLRNPEAGLPRAAYTQPSMPLIPPRLIEGEGGQRFLQYEEGERVYPQAGESTARTEADRVRAERRRQLWEELQDLRKQQTPAGATMAQKYRAKEKLSDIEKGIALDYIKREERIKSLTDELQAAENQILQPTPRAELPPGMGGGTTNRIGRFEIITPGTNQPAY
jgi:hypothetical protein